jgi:hypothetical protein
VSKICYYVLQQGGQWKIKIGGKHYGPYKSRTDAINVAVATANKVGITHHDGAKVLVESTVTDRWHTEWASGKDSLPPKAWQYWPPLRAFLLAVLSTIRKGLQSHFSPSRPIDMAGCASVEVLAP